MPSTRYPASAELQEQISLWMHIEVQPNTANTDAGVDGTAEIVYDCYLPAPQNLVEGNAHNWETVALGSLKNWTDLGMVAPGSEGFGDYISELASDVSGGLQNLYKGLGLPWPKAFGATELFRHVANPRNELQYQSPALRTWNFSWQFANHSKEDASTLGAILMQLKKSQ